MTWVMTLLPVVLLVLGFPIFVILLATSAVVIVSFYSIPPTALQLSTGVAVLSYGDELVFGITADYNAAPEMERLAAGIELGMARLVALSQDSVLLFTKDRRKRSSRASGGAQRRAFSPPARARH